MKVCVIGLGYIGLPTSGVLATHGHDVLGVDVSSHVVDTINQGQIHIHEPDLDTLIHKAIASKRFRASLKPECADIFIVAVPTPFKGDHEPDLSYVESATKAIASELRPGNLVILESTSPVGTTELMAEIIRDLRKDLTPPKWKDSFSGNANLFFAHCPERVLPGQILKELIQNDRVVGGVDTKSTEKACEFYRTFVKGAVVPTDCRTAELAKLTENSYRDVNIAFANELSLISEKMDINVWELIDIANRHPRVNILQPGPGVGGHCIAVDPWFIVHACPEEAQLIRTAREVNDKKPLAVIEKVLKIAARFNEPKIACLGLAFKPDIDDLRESPSVEIVRHLAEKKVGELLVVEPHIHSLPISLSKHTNIHLVEAKTALMECDIVLLLVNHQEFKEINPGVLVGKSIIDTRGVWRQ